MTTQEIQNWAFMQSRLSPQEQQARAERLEQEQEARRAAIRTDMPGELAGCGAPEHFRHARLDNCPDLPAALVQAARQWAQNPTGFLYLYGRQPGAGKTTVAVAVLAHALGHGPAWPAEARFVDERGYLDQLRRAFDGDGYPPDDDSSAAQPESAKLLVFDDLGATRLTDWGKGEVAGLLENRHAADLPTIITSNLV